MPNLGVVDVGNFDSFVMADIPGIIDGASEGRGLGIEFLRHIERTKLLLFVLDLCNYRSLQEQYEKLKMELKSFSSPLDSKPFGIILSKADISSDTEGIFKEFIKINQLDVILSLQDGIYTQKALNQGFGFTLDQSKPLFVLPTASATHFHIDELKRLLSLGLKP